MKFVSDQGHQRCVLYLKSKGAVEVDPSTMVCVECKSVFDSVARGHTTCITCWLQRGTDVNCKDGDGWTVLMHLSKAGNLEMVKLLFDKGAEINAEANDGSTALMIATISSKSECAEYLQSKGGEM